MKIFYDTEFLEDGKTIELISIGMVAEDGREYYAIPFDGIADRPRLARAIRNSWLAANVIPSLPITLRSGTEWSWNVDHPDIDHVKSRSQIADEARRFVLGDDPDELPYVELWADYGAYDHVALCQLFGTMMDLPEGMPMFTHDIQQAASARGLSYKDLPEQESGLHNALADARHAKAKFDFLKSRGAPDG